MYLFCYICLTYIYMSFMQHLRYKFINGDYSENGWNCFVICCGQLDYFD
jgi:hypothetical protein